ncbi:MAG: hypothetical protein KIIPBIDF_01305 [Candidatus Methanoperedenaceae archaeon GB50]|nr:MAG: hypothetical protein KIIPBIDF_01305 [Candidatus Methanoperedenaceae archaeon GB50]
MDESFWYFNQVPVICSNLIRAGKVKKKEVLKIIENNNYKSSEIKYKIGEIVEIVEKIGKLKKK